ncbi:MAG: acetylornithine transaminase [Clostridia bacterium]|nr:acetylornithine transaminase [Clostridia bacterium]
MSKTQEIIEAGQQFVMNTYGRNPIALVEGNGVLVWDAEGKKYLDFVAGIAVNALGHCHPAVVEAVEEQAKTLMHCSNLYWNEPQVNLAKFLVKNTCCDKAFFCNSGAEANEGAIKLARKYAKLNSGADKYEIISALESFHGRTLAAITATGQLNYQKGFEPLPEGFKHVVFNDLKALEEAISPNTCAIMLESIQAEGGINIATAEYLQGVKELCEKHDLLLIMDEVQTGIGRTGKFMGYQHYDIEPDIITLAKALGGGFPIGAMLAKAHVAVAFQPGDHASTFGGNPLACAAALATMETMINRNVLENVVEVGEYFMGKLQALGEKYATITEIRGRGLIIGVDVTVEVAEVMTKCREAGLLIVRAGANTLRFIPPLNITTGHVDQAVAILDQVLTEMGGQ